jgi:flagellar biogenesis protein FliO
MNNPSDSLNLQELKGMFNSLTYILVFIGLLVVVYIFMRVQQRRRLDRMRRRQHQKRLLR